MTPQPRPTHTEIYARLGEILGRLDSIDDRLGHENVDGEGKVTGTGLTGRLIRTEARVHAYDQLRDRIMGGLVVAPLFIAALWWLIKAKVAAVFGVSGADG